MEIANTEYGVWKCVMDDGRESERFLWGRGGKHVKNKEIINIENSSDEGKLDWSSKDYVTLSSNKLWKHLL